MGMKHYSQAQAGELPSLGVDGIRAFLKDVAGSQDERAPISAGFFRMEAGSPLEYAYSYDECKLMLEGEMTVAEKGGATVTLRPGDVMFFAKGTTVVFSSVSSGTAFYVGQRRLGEL